MTDYEFTLKFSLPPAADPERCIGALAAVGCEDALVGIGQGGRIALAFTRTSRSAFEAVSTALRDVRKALPKSKLIEAAPDYVGLTDVAELLGFTRQNMRKLMLANLSTFPAAVHEGNPALWHLASVLAWMVEREKRQVDVALLDVARTTMALNIAKETRTLSGATLPTALEKLFA